MANTQPTRGVGNSPAGAGGLPTSFGELLRWYRDRAAMTQGKAATQVQVSRATFAQWETGRHLPAEERVHQLDELLEAGGELIATAEQARATPPRLRPVATDEPGYSMTGNRSVLHVLNEARRLLIEQLCSTRRASRPGGGTTSCRPATALASCRQRKD